MSLTGNTISLAMFTAIAIGACFAQENGGGGRIAGTWDTRLAIINCQTGDVLGMSDSVGTFIVGGTFIDSASRVPQALKTPGQGIWKHVEGNTYRYKFKSLSFNPAGNFVGYVIIDHEAILNSTADVYESLGTAEFYDADGNLLAVGCSSTVSTRFKFD